MTTEIQTQLAEFLESWTTDENGTKTSFQTLHEYMQNLPEAVLDFVPRPGITYSLRAAHPCQQERTLFVMVDVIDDDPDDRWLSVVFYKDMVKDPDEQADEVPGGLMGADARCFDLYEHDQDMVDYIKARMDEALKSAAL